MPLFGIVRVLLSQAFATWRGWGADYDICWRAPVFLCLRWQWIVLSRLGVALLSFVLVFRCVVCFWAPPRLRQTPQWNLTELRATYTTCPQSRVRSLGCEYSGLILTNFVPDEFVVVAVIVAVERHWQWRCSHFGALTWLVRLPSTIWICYWKVSWLFQLWHWNICNFVISWFCDICAILWFCESVTSGLINCDDRYWSEHLHVLENCEFGMSWFLQPWPPSNLRACEFGCCSCGTTTWNPSFMLFETKLAGIDTFRCLEYRLQVLNKVGWFFIDNVKLLESVFGKQNSWPILFWPNEFELTILVEPK